MDEQKNKPDPVLEPGQEWCIHCDGCGWYEGGETIVTVCEDCKGTGRTGS